VRSQAHIRGWLSFALELGLYLHEILHCAVGRHRVDGCKHAWISNPATTFVVELLSRSVGNPFEGRQCVLGKISEMPISLLSHAVPTFLLLRNGHDETSVRCIDSKPETQQRDADLWLLTAK
jgi:hypothetical protein